MTLLVKKLSKTATIPTVAHPNEDIGYDISSDEDIIIPPHSGKWISTGIAIGFDNPEHGCKIEGRSSLASLDIFPIGGIIDPGYRGEVKVRLYNGSNEEYLVFRGDKIAQLVRHVELANDSVEVINIPVFSLQRGDKGFGSSNK